MMVSMDADWARLGSALRAARKARGLEQLEVAARIGVGRGALRNIETGAVSRLTPTVRTYARIVGWTDASIEAVLAGGDPELAPEGSAADNDRGPVAVTVDDATSPSDLPLRIKAALAAGPLLDTAVIDLPTEDGEDPEAQMVVIIKGRQGATPEQIKRALLQWERAETNLRKPPAGG